jgi:hypothetical protein
VGSQRFAFSQKIQNLVFGWKSHGNHFLGRRNSAYSIYHNSKFKRTIEIKDLQRGVKRICFCLTIARPIKHAMFRLEFRNVDLLSGAIHLTTPT